MDIDSAGPQASSSTQEVVPDPSQDHLLTLSERLAADMAQRWRGGQKVYAHELFRRHPELLGCRDAAFRLICEEVCLTQEAGLNPSFSDLAGRFPDWQTEIQRFLECQDLLRADAEPAPAEGNILGDFQVVCELGQGALGRVVLARQTSLGNRPVVLKITPRKGQEHLSLARLQHTYISPLYGVHDEQEKDQRILCMPFFGTLTLHEVLGTLHTKPPAERTGKDLVDLLERAQSKVPIELPGQGPFRRSLARESYARAICWLGSCLADALHYAHERGLVHLDLKPSNVLLADDAQPMLLDFHLARAPIPTDGPRPVGIGGTPQYMSPEQRLLVSSLCEKKPILLPVDGRSDVYSLGLILYQLLGGPVPLPKQAPPLNTCNPMVSPGLADIVHKCLAGHPGGRYQTAGAVAEDLRRHLSHSPLRGVRNRSWRESIRKWQIRNPGLAPLIPAVVALVIIAGMATVIWHRSRQTEVRDRLASAQESLDHARKDIEDRRFQSARDRLKAALRLAVETPDAQDLEEQLKRQLELAERGKIAADLHDIADGVRYRAGALHDRLIAKNLVRNARQLWDEREQIMAAFPKPGDAEAKQARMDLLDVAVVLADMRATRASKTDSAAYRSALKILGEAESLLGVSPVLFRDRFRYASALGLSKEANAAARALAERPPHTSWEAYSLGRSWLREGELERASGLFRKAVALAPRDFWANFYQGVCAYRRQEWNLAVSAFRAAVTLQPENAIAFYNRGRAYSRIPDPESALADYTQALKLNPGLADAALNRGVLYLKAKQYRQALHDLNYALARGSNPALTHFNLALVHAAQHHRHEALASVRAALHADPSYKEAIQLERKLAAGP